MKHHVGFSTAECKAPANEILIVIPAYVMSINIPLLLGLVHEVKASEDVTSIECCHSWLSKPFCYYV